ncbi:MAG: sigma-70 family RNA polymerase sigma factor [Bradymonadales bacterium]|nr:sigma-70 family RNA polymerase sigma factor [Bradymonadales bacterium]
MIEMTGSFDQLLSEGMRRGYVAAYRILAEHEEAQEAIQEAAARALAARRRYDPAQPFYPWFYRILKNHCLDRLKRRKRGIETPLTTQEPPGSSTAESPVERESLASERIQAVTRAIEALPAELREVIELRHFQDLSYQEMAEILDYPVGTVMSRLYRARKQIRELLLADSSDFSPKSRIGRPS